MTSWHAPQKILALGSKWAQDLLLDDVIVEEKIDGSFFAAGFIDGELKMRSKGVQFESGNPEKMFTKVAQTVELLKDKLTPGWTYRGEYLQKSKHNVLAYDRVPTGHWIIFDICRGEEDYLSYEEKAAECARIGLECVPLLFKGKVAYPDQLMNLMATTSILGGQKIEGIVIKNYARMGMDKKALFAKHVSEEFKEVHKKDWKERNPGQGDIIAVIGQSLRTPARWHKAIIHLREKGLLTDSPKDIGLLLKEIKEDTLLECSDMIKEQLFQWAIDNILRQVTSGVPQFYKEELLKKQFESKG